MDQTLAWLFYNRLCNAHNLGVKVRVIEPR
jgi:hypothetical protein